MQMQIDEEHKNFIMAQDTADRLCEKLNIQKRQLGEAVWDFKPFFLIYFFN